MVISNSFLTLRNLIIFLIIFFSLLYSFLFYLYDAEFIQTCKFSPYSRKSNPDVTGKAILNPRERDFLSFTWIRFLLALLSWQIYDAFGRERKFFFALFAFFLSYFPAIYALHFIKEVMRDRECGDQESFKGNGVSGHSFYISWAILTIIYLNQLLSRQLQHKPRTLNYATSFPEKLSKMFYGNWTIISSSIILIFQGVITFRYGYHSLRQIYLGAICGLVWVLISLSFLNKYISRFLLEPRKFLSKDQHNS